MTQKVRNEDIFSIILNTISNLEYLRTLNIVWKNGGKIVFFAHLRLLTLYEQLQTAPTVKVKAVP